MSLSLVMLPAKLGSCVGWSQPGHMTTPSVPRPQEWRTKRCKCTWNKWTSARDRVLPRNSLFTYCTNILIIIWLSDTVLCVHICHSVALGPSCSNTWYQSVMQGVAWVHTAAAGEISLVNGVIVRDYCRRLQNQYRVHVPRLTTLVPDRLSGEVRVRALFI